MKILQGSAIFFLLLFFSSTAFAHKFIMSTWVEGDTVYLEAGFSDGTTAKHAKIEVFDNSSGDKLLDGETDDSGEFSCKIPKKTELRIHGNAGMGHQGESIIPLEDVAEAFPGDGADLSESAGSVTAETEAPVVSPTPAAAGISEAELQKIVETAVEKKLRPLLRKMAEQDMKGPSLQDIMGGIGYIIGLIGLGTYINYRRKSK